MDPSDPRTGLYLGQPSESSNAPSAVVKIEAAPDHNQSQMGVQNTASPNLGPGGTAMAVKSEAAANEVTNGNATGASPYLSQNLPTSAAPVMPAPGTVLPSSTVPVQDPRYAGVATSSTSPPPSPSGRSSGPSSAPTTLPSTSSVKNPSNVDGIWVGGLPKDVTVEKLAKYFGEFGELKMDRSKDPPAPAITLFRDHHTGAPKGEARVLWETPELATLAVEYFNGKHWPGGGNIRVELSHSRAERSERRDRGERGDRHYGDRQGYDARGGYPHYAPPQPAYDPRYAAPPPVDPYAQNYQPQPYGAAPPGLPPQLPPQGPGAYDPYYNPDPYAQQGAYPGYAPPYGGQQPYQPPAAAPYGAPPPAAYSQPNPAYAPAPYAPPPQPGYAPYSGYQPPGYSGYPGAPQGYGEAPPPGYGEPVRMFRGKGGAARAGDWVCPSCGNNNFSWRTVCKQCNVARPAHASVVEQDEAASGSRRPKEFNAGVGIGRGPGAEHSSDWICPKCSFRNFSRRETCHDCGTHRPVDAQYVGMNATGPNRYVGIDERRRERSEAPY